MLNALTVDVEDYWSIFSRDWLHQDMEPTDAVVRNTEWLLQTLERYNIRATFFILGEVAKSFPYLIKEIAENGHEIAVHGFYHRQIFKLSREEFKKEVGDAKKLLEDLSGQEVIGHRAPAFSINKDTRWALEVLAELGFIYDSSVSPKAGKRYGWPGFKKEIHRMQLTGGQSIIEVPMSTVSLGFVELMIGGGYMRHFPYLYTRLAIKYIQKRRPTVVYMHPYEIDTDEKKFELDKLTAQEKSRVLRHHKLQLRNRNTMKNKINKLLLEFRFTSIKSVISEA